MSQPPFPYNRIFDFESFSIVNPTTQQPGIQIEGELDGIKRTVDGIMSRLSEIQRDDGYIRDSALDQSTLVPQLYNQVLPLLLPILDTKAEVQHTHPISNVVGLQDALTNAKIQDYDNFKIYSAGDMVTADNRFFKFNATIGAAGYGPITHPSAWTEQSARPDLSGYALTTAVTAGLAGKANTTHTHLIADTTGLQAALDGKSAATHLHTGVYAPVTHSHVIADVSSLQTVLDGKSATTHLHTGVYAPVAHSHVIGDTTGLQTALDGKASLSGATFTGRIGVGVAPDSVAALKVNAGGIMFNDGTTLTTAPTGGGGGGAVTSVAGRTGAVVLSNTDISGLGTMATQSASNYALLSGTTFSGAVTATSFTTSGNFTSTGTGSFQTTSGAIFTSSGNIFTTTGNIYANAGSINTARFIGTPANGIAALNIGIGGTSTDSTSAGDLWIASGGVSLNYRDASGAWRILPALNNANVFSANQVVAAATTGALLRITQTGTGNALVVEDTNNPDTTPFVIDNNGRVGVGVAPSTTAAIKVDAGGIMFNDGTTQTSAGLSGTGYALLSGATFTGQITTTRVVCSGQIVSESQINGLQVNATGNITGNNVIAYNNLITPNITITQLNNGNAFVVEDSASPDTTAFVINASGKVGIGVNPSGFNPAVHILSVVGNVSINGLLDLASQTTQAHTNAFTVYNNEIKVNINGVDRWIPIR